MQNAKKTARRNTQVDGEKRVGEERLWTVGTKEMVNRDERGASETE